ncbi:MAG TPA: SpoIIE family protein phosphatase [bacterium]|nr:SpoIIE family protein phosphatase [bacterium]HPR89179.1 SpoIIE family protein phosphatase [bacterium]
MPPPANIHRFSLRLKIILLFLLLVIVMMTTVGYIYTVRELNLRREQMALRIGRLANNIAAVRSVETGDWDGYQTYIDNQIIVNPDIVYIAILDDQGRLKVHALNRDWLELEARRPLTRLEQASLVLRLDQRQIATESQRDFARQSVQIMVGAKSLGTVNIGFSLVDLNDEMKRNLVRNLLLDLLFLVLAATIAYLAGSRIIHPLEKLTTAMEKISHGDFDQELKITSRDEIGAMAATFNYMTRGLQEKAIIESFSHELGFTIELDKIARLITGHIAAALQSGRSLLLLQRGAPGHFFLLSSTPPDGSPEGLSVDLEESGLEELGKWRAPAPLHHLAQHASPFAALRTRLHLSPEALLAPLLIKEEIRGLFLLDRPQERAPYSDEELLLLTTMLSQGAIAIENALLYEELTEQERLKREFEIARRVQLSLLPQRTPEISGLDVAGVCLPAEEIGGDYYDYFELDDHTLGIAIADVTGKGSSAAFYMAVIKGIMLSLTTLYRSPRVLLRELNGRVLQTVERRIFATMIYATLDTRKKVLTFARAGHNALIRRTAGPGVVESLTPGGIGLGLAGDDHFEQHISEAQVRYRTGDLFVFYTDGLSEAMNRERQEFGEEKLLEYIASLDGCTAREANAGIIGRILEHVQQGSPHDDITLVTVRAL